MEGTRILWLLPLFMSSLFAFAAALDWWKFAHPSGGTASDADLRRAARWPRVTSYVLFNGAVQSGICVQREKE